MVIKRLRWTAPSPASIWKGAAGGGAVGVVLAGAWGANALTATRSDYLFGIVTIIGLITALVGSGLAALVATIYIAVWRALFRKPNNLSTWAVVVVVSLVMIGTFFVVALTSADVFDGSILGNRIGAGIVAAVLAGISAAWAHLTVRKLPDVGI